MKKKTYIINHIPIEQIQLEENIILIKDVQIWVDQKMLKNIMKKNSLWYIKGLKFKNWVVQKIKGLKKLS
jgi:hypothetical protein